MVRVKAGSKVTVMLYVAAIGAHFVDEVFDLKLNLDAPNATLVVSSSASNTGQMGVVVNAVTEAEYPVVRPLPPFPARST